MLKRLALMMGLVLTASWSMADSVTDDLGRKVEMPRPPARIAAGVPFAVEILCDLGSPPVARPELPADHVRPRSAEAIPAIAVNHGSGPNLEQLATFTPDLLILSPTFAQFAEPVETTLNVPVLVYGIRSLPDVPRLYRTFGSLLGRAEAGDRLALKLESAIEKRRRPAGKGPTVFAIFGAGDSFYAFLPESYLGSMVSHLGGTLVTDDVEPIRRGATMGIFSMELVLERRPDLVLIARHGEGDPVAALKASPAWQGISAVEQGQVHQISEWLYVTNPGPSAIEALDDLEALLYPTGEGAP